VEELRKIMGKEKSAYCAPRNDKPPQIRYIVGKSQMPTFSEGLRKEIKEWQLQRRMYYCQGN
jgi:hypothetical protein